jgi:hypothetical protein
MYPKIENVAWKRIVQLVNDHLEQRISNSNQGFSYDQRRHCAEFGILGSPIPYEYGSQSLEAIDYSEPLRQDPVGVT